MEQSNIFLVNKNSIFPFFFPQVKEKKQKSIVTPIFCDVLFIYIFYILLFSNKIYHMYLKFMI